MRGFISIPGLFVFFVVAIMLINLFPFFQAMVNVALPGTDMFTQVFLAMLIPLMLIGLLIGYYNSVTNPSQGYQ